MNLQPLRPSCTIPLKLIEHTRGRSATARAYRRIDTSLFPEHPGAYVVRYENHAIPRLRGSSRIIRIGSSDERAGIALRFDQYNHQIDVTTTQERLSTLLLERSQKTNVYLMYYLSNLAEKDSVVVDIYAERHSLNARKIEQSLLVTYFDEHYELPPLNNGFR